MVQENATNAGFIRGFQLCVNVHTIEYALIFDAPFSMGTKACMFWGSFVNLSIAIQVIAASLTPRLDSVQNTLIGGSIIITLIEVITNSILEILGP